MVHRPGYYPTTRKQMIRILRQIQSNCDIESFKKSGINGLMRNALQLKRKNEAVATCKMKSFFTANAALYAILLASLAADCLGGEPPKLRFLPQWSPQAQFAGYYVAEAEGLYKKHGIDVELLAGGPEMPATDSLKAGRADIITLFLASGIKERCSGTDIVNIAQLSKRSALIFAAKKSSGISKPSDMNGRKLGLWYSDFREVPLAFLKKYDLDMEIVPLGGTINLFLRDGVDVTIAMWYNEYHTIMNSGLDPEDLTSFFFFDHGLDVPEDGIYCLAGQYGRNPEAFRAFVAASAEGWETAFADPEKAVGTVIKKMNEAHLPANRAHQKWMLARMKDLFYKQGEGGALGTALDEKAYRKTCEILIQSGSIKEAPEYSAFHISIPAKPQPNFKDQKPNPK